MIVLLLPISLLGLLLLTSFVYSITNFATPYSTLQSPLSFDSIALSHLTEWTSKPDIQVSASITLPASYQSLPLRLKLDWTDISMTERRESADSMADDVPATAIPTMSSRSMKRFSVQLPIVDAKDHARTLSAESQQISPQDASDKVDPINFLVALAAQERRVLELKEELQKAETDLTKLKKQWAHHEATRKRQEVRQQAEPMRSMKPSTEDATMTRASDNLDMQAKRRPAALRTKQTHRKVFEGGRHTRALSLLSPTSLANRGSVTESQTSAIRESESTNVPMTAIPRVTSSSNEQNKTIDPSKEDIVTTGKQIMGDIKEGLWTFIEDLRQATVGDEARTSPVGGTISTTTQQKAIPEGVGRSNRNKPTIVGTHTIQHGANSAIDSKSTEQLGEGKLEEIVRAASPINDSDDEGWDNWDSPPHKSVTSTFTSPARSTPRSSISSDVNRQSASMDQIPWPALQKLPGNLTRTASHLMNEWEKSLHSSVDDQGR